MIRREHLRQWTACAVCLAVLFGTAAVAPKQKSAKKKEDAGSAKSIAAPTDKEPDGLLDVRAHEECARLHRAAAGYYREALEEVTVILEKKNAGALKQL